MSPLSIVKFIVEHFQGTAYEPWVNVLLFLVFVAAVYGAISLLLGSGGREFIIKAASAATSELKNRKGYAPEWEGFRLRAEPYLSFFSSLYFAFIGIYSATLVGLALILGAKHAPWWALVLALIWVMASFFYMRINLESASWSYHEIKKRKG